MEKILNVLKDLPILSILDDIVSHADTGGVTIVNAETASGKSLLIPASIQDGIKELVKVFEPRRFLAINAAETLADLSGTVLGERFDYIVSARGEQNEHSVSRKFRGVKFTTYGYALAVHEVITNQNIVLDEIHEPGMDIALIKALIKKSFKEDAGPKRLVLMSATMNTEDEVEYWKEYNPKVFTITDTQRFKCNRRWEPASSVYGAALHLVDSGSRGILCFVPGVQEIKETVKLLNEAIAVRNEDEVKIEVASIHGLSDYAERISALSAPQQGSTKILVGTNVLESGMNLRWVDAGVTSGTHKENEIVRSSNAIALLEVPLSKSNVDQQAGRTNRFCESTFVICGQVDPTKMKTRTESELTRLPLTKLYMDCVGHGVDPRELDFMPKIDHERLDYTAKILRQLGFLDDENNITKDGESSQIFPVGPETAALLCCADKLNVLSYALPLAAVYENGTLQHDRRIPFWASNTSDHFANAIAFSRVFSFPKDMSYQEKKESIEKLNVNRKKYTATLEVLQSLEKVLLVESDFSIYQSNHEIHFDDKNNPNAEIIHKLRVCLFAAGINHVGSTCYVNRKPVVIIPRDITNAVVSLEAGSSVWVPYVSTLVTATLRVITPKNSYGSFTVAENVTRYEPKDILAFDKIRPGELSFKAKNPYGDVEISLFGKTIGTFCDYPEIEYIPEKVVSTSTWPGDRSISLGDVLQEAISKRGDLLEKLAAPINSFTQDKTSDDKPKVTNNKPINKKTTQNKDPATSKTSSSYVSLSDKEKLAEFFNSRR